MRRYKKALLKKRHQAGALRQVPRGRGGRQGQDRTAGELCRTRSLARQKKYIYNPQHINGLSYHPLNYKTEFLTSYLYKTRHLTAQDGFVARFCYTGAVLSFSFLFISAIFKKS